MSRRRVLQLLAGSVLAGSPAWAFAQAGLQRVRMAVDGETTRLVLDMGAATEYELFALDRPDRLVVDLRDTRALGGLELVDHPRALVTGVRHAARNSKDLRVVFDLRGPVDVQSFSLMPSGGASHRLVIDMRADPEALLRQAAAERSGSSTPASESEWSSSTSTPQSEPARSESERADASRSAEPNPRDRETVARAQEPEPRSEPQPEPRSEPRVERSPPRNLRDVIVAIDAGHGGHDPGAIGPGGTREKDIVLQIAKRLQARVDREPGMKSYLVRTGDYFLPLRERMERARRANADVFISLHADAAYNREVQGSSVYMLSARGASSEAARFLAERENAVDSRLGGVSVSTTDASLASVLLDLAQSGSLEASGALATGMINELHRVGKVRKPQVERANFAVLRSPDVPSVLVEAAFISNPSEERRLRTASFQDSLADALLTGLRAYFSTHAPPGTTIAEGRPDRHIIRPGESLSIIAERYGVPVSAIRAANNLSGDRIVTGQVLKIPLSSASR